MATVRFGVVGLGAMGLAHARMLADGTISRAELTAVCSSDSARAAAQLPGVQHFDNLQDLVQSGRIDALLVATPHLSHPQSGIMALEAGLHVMMEKPIASSKSEAERLLDAHTNLRQVFAVMFNLRTRPWFRKAHELIRNGVLGEIRRVSWTATEFFRTAAYYSNSKWRGTWDGEGGGVLLNQAPHHLDLLQWWFGMPAVVRGFCTLGKYHDIEVEDEATAFLEFPGGATCTFVTSTGEAPGTTRIEVAGELGRLVIENQTLTFIRNAVSMSQFSRTEKSPMSVPETDTVVMEAEGNGGNYAEMLRNFVDAILDGTALIAPAAEALHSLELANAILLSSLQERSIRMPLDGPEYERCLLGFRRPGP